MLSKTSLSQKTRNQVPPLIVTRETETHRRRRQQCGGWQRKGGGRGEGTQYTATADDLTLSGGPMMQYTGPMP